MIGARKEEEEREREDRREMPRPPLQRRTVRWPKLIKAPSLSCREEVEEKEKLFVRIEIL